MLEQHPPDQVTMASVAAASGFSRMAVYRHFGSRAGLLTALLAYIDESEGADEAVCEILRAPSPEEMVTHLFSWWAGYVSRFAGVARGVLAAKGADPDLGAAWDDRMRDLRRLCDEVAGRSCRGSEVQEVFADELWALVAVPLWIQLADDGWSPDRYAATMTRMALASLPRP